MAAQLGSSPQMQCETVSDAAARTVLLVDDEAAIRTLVGRVLRNKGYQVLEAPDGVAALELADRHAGPIHLLLTDWRMPRLDGGGLSRGLSAIRPGTAVLIMTGYCEAELPAGAAVLLKPFTVADLMQKVRDVLDRPNLSPAAGTGG